MSRYRLYICISIPFWLRKQSSNAFHYNLLHFQSLLPSTRQSDECASHSLCICDDQGVSSRDDKTHIEPFLLARSMWSRETRQFLVFLCHFYHVFLPCWRWMMSVMLSLLILTNKQNKNQEQGKCVEMRKKKAKWGTRSVENTVYFWVHDSATGDGTEAEGKENCTKTALLLFSFAMLCNVVFPAKRIDVVQLTTIRTTGF